MPPAVNAATNKEYPFQKGSVEERTLYRVTPVYGGSKLYFDSKEQYLSWRQATIEADKTAVLKGLNIHIIPGLTAKKT